MKNIGIKLFFAGLVLLSAASLGYKLYPSEGGGGAPAVEADITVTTITPPLEKTESDRPEAAPSLGKTPNVNPVFLKYESQYIDTDALTPTVCFRFSEVLDPKKQPQYNDFIDVMPETSLSVTVNQSRLCLAGFDFARDYNVTLKSGLPALEASGLERRKTIPVSFGARPPFVGFSGNGIILPRKDSQGLAFETVNVETLDVTIYKVNDRMLARRTPSVGLLTAEGDYGWEYEDAAVNIRTQLWSGEVDVESIANQRVTTNLPVSDLVGNLEDGAYVVSISRGGDSDNVRWPARAWRWIIVTDLAVTSYSGDHGLTVFTRSLQTAQRQAGTEVHLIAENNTVLGKAVTDRTGKAAFPAPLLAGAGADSPRMLLAYGAEGDFAMIDLQRSPLDLSDYDIAGRKKTGLIDGYGFADRGVYRPGETSHLTFMFRGENIQALSPDLATLNIIRPDNITALTARVSAEDFKAGSYYTAYNIPKEAPRGTWMATLLADGQDSAVKIDFDVQDFVPQKLRVAFKSTDEIYDGSRELRLPLQADFLYGAPATGLPADGEARLEIDPKPFPDFTGYQFAPRDPDFTRSLHYLNGGATDDTGTIDLVLENLPQVKSSHLPLRLQITGGVAEPSGRYVRDSVFIPARSQTHYAGIRSNYKTHRIPRSEAAEFEVILVDQGGVQASGELNWVLMEQDWDYQWYKDGGSWRYRRDLREQILEGGALALKDETASTWSKRLGWGDYRLVLKDGERELNSYQFSVGWGQKTKSDKPDALQIAAPETGIKSGGRFTLSVTSPYDGEADLILTNNETFISKPISLSEGVSEIDLTYDASWGTGIYALISLYTPRDVETLPIPRRALGTAYIRRDTSPTTLQLSFEGPNVVKPRQPYIATVKALQKGKAPKGKVWLNLAAVDEGILQITKFKSPSAETFFHSKTALSTSIYDDYGRILNPNLGTSARVRSGGDGIGGEGLTVIPQKTVALFKGYVEMENGTAIIPVDIPDYNGELRLMATAWSDKALGSASMPLTVRDPVPVDVALPRFIAPGDEVDVVISANNLDGPEGVYAFDIETDETLSLADNALSFDLPRGVRSDQSLSMTAKGEAITQLSYTVTGPNNYSVTGETRLQTRSPFLPTTQAKKWTIAAGESLTIDPDFISNLVAGSVDVTMSVTDGRLIDPAPYISTLRRYPYGCSEQTVSAALPLLYAQDFGADAKPQLVNYEAKMQEAIDKLALRQSVNGSFGLWREGDQSASLWLGVYVSDFMLRADKAGYSINSDVLERTRSALGIINQLNASQSLNYRVNVNYHDAGKNQELRKVDAAAYAGYLMARDGRGRLGQARYIFDSFKDRIQSPLSFGFLSETFAALGDEARAKAAYDLAVKALGFEDQDNYYQTPLRDLAALVAVLSNKDYRIALADRLSDDIDEPNQLRTQELAHIVLALRGQAQTPNDIRFTATGADFDQQSSGGVLTYASAHVYDRDIQKGVTITNQGKDRIVLKALASGSPAAAPPATSEGLTVEKTLHDLTGKIVSPDDIRRGGRYVVKVEFASKQRRGRTVVLADLLPAGLEIEQILQTADGKQEYNTDGPFAWLGDISTFDMTEARDDRFIASGDTQRRDSYIAAYIVRAVATGDFAFPGAVVEDMYRPGDRAITESTRLRISNGGSL